MGFDSTKPEYYKGKKVETIEYLEGIFTSEAYQGFCCGNIIKYVSRYKSKNGIEDLKKAKAYIDFLIKHLVDISKTT